MKSVFFLHYPVNPHLETDLELMARCLDNHEEVFAIMCNRGLKTCFHNLNHKKSICINCQARYRKGLEVLNIPKENIINLPKKYLKNTGIPIVFNDVDELMKFQMNGINYGLFAASTLIHEFNKDHNFNTIQYQKPVYRMLETVYYAYQTISNIIDEYHIDCLYIFNGRFSISRAIVTACKDKKIEFYTHERSGSQNKYVLRKNTLPQDQSINKIEMFELWENSPLSFEEKQKIGSSFFLERKNAIDQGWLSYTSEQKKGSLPEDFNKNRKNIVIYINTIEEGYTLQEFQNNLYKDEIIGVGEILEAFKTESKYHFYVRVHPNLRGNRNSQVMKYEEYGRKYKNATIIPAESTVSSYALMEVCDIVITAVSSIGIESVFWGKPVILTNDIIYAALEITYNPKTHDEVVNLIKSDLKPRDNKRAIIYGFWEKTYGTKYKYFHQEGFHKGLFKGTVIEEGKRALIISAFYRLFEIRSLIDLKKFINRVKSRIKNNY